MVREERRGMQCMQRMHGVQKDEKSAASQIVQTTGRVVPCA